MEVASDQPARRLSGEEAGEAGASRRARPAALRVPAVGLTGALALFVLLALVVSSVLLGLQLRAAAAEQSRDDAILAAARQEVVNFTTIDYRHLSRDFARITEGATGQFKKEFSGRTGQLDELLTQNRTVSEGEVIEAGVVSADDDSASVIVVANAQVTNSAEPRGASRHYRMKLSLVRAADRWLTSQVEFVG